MQGGSPSEFVVTPKGERALEAFWISSVGSVMSDYEYGILQAAKEGLLKPYRLVERYGTEGSKVIRKLLDKGWLITTPSVDDLDLET